MSRCSSLNIRTVTPLILVELFKILHVLKERLVPQATLKPKAMESLQDPEVPVRSKVFAVRAISQ